MVKRLQKQGCYYFFFYLIISCIEKNINHGIFEVGFRLDATHSSQTTSHCGTISESQVHAASGRTRLCMAIQRVSLKIAAAVSFHPEDDPPESENVNRFLIYPAASPSAAADYFPALQSFIVFLHMHRTCSHALLHRATQRLRNTHAGMRACQHSPSVSTHSAGIRRVQTTGWIPNSGENPSFWRHHPNPGVHSDPATNTTHDRDMTPVITTASTCQMEPESVSLYCGFPSQHKRFGSWYFYLSPPTIATI